MIALLLAAAAPAVTPQRLPPIELCRGDADFDRFRAALVKAVSDKDSAALQLLVANDIRSSFGGDGGWSEFAASWGLDTDPAASKLWPQLQSLFKLGCAPTQAGGRVLPSLFQDSGEDADPFELVVARPGAGLYAKADGDRPIATLDWHSARQVDPVGEGDWVKVKLFDGREGWLKASDTLSPLG
ncbi:MAG: hypothetical protein ABIS23_06790, partial [Sphingomicrobium sp.]